MNYGDEKDLMSMKLLHYFITEKNYNPVIVHGVQNEIWLENMDMDVRLVRIVMHHIHNSEQLDFDIFKVKRMTRQIKMKTFSLNIKSLSIYLDINEDVELENSKNTLLVSGVTEKMLFDSYIMKKYFSDIKSKMKFTEEGALLYEKINNDILKDNINKTKQINEIFSPKKPIVTVGLISLMIFIMLLMMLYGGVTLSSVSIKTLYNFGGLVKNGSIIRSFLSIFLHIGIIHLVMNLYALYIIGKQVEGFYGHVKMFVIFIYSGLIGNLLSVTLMNSHAISAGASGAIFGLMGALLYFAINQRTYMSNALKESILPVILINLFISFMVPGINLFAHLGGLIGGIIISTALGIKYKTSNFEKRNGFIAAGILLIVLGYMAYFM